MTSRSQKPTGGGGGDTHGPFPSVLAFLPTIVPLSCLSSPCLGAQVFFWKHKAKSTVLEHHDSQKSVVKVEKTPRVIETFKLVEPCEEAKISKTEETPKVADPFTLVTSTDKAEVEQKRGGRSLLQLPRTAVKSVSTLMVSALQSGWRLCTWKVSTVLPCFPGLLPPSLIPHDSSPPSGHLVDICFCVPLGP